MFCDSEMKSRFQIHENKTDLECLLLRHVDDEALRECCLRFLAQVMLENCTNIPENIIVKLMNYA